MRTDAVKSMFSDGQGEPMDEASLVTEMVKEDKLQKAKQLRDQKEATSGSTLEVMATGGMPVEKY